MRKHTAADTVSAAESGPQSSSGTDSPRVSVVVAWRAELVSKGKVVVGFEECK